MVTLRDLTLIPIYAMMVKSKKNSRYEYIFPQTSFKTKFKLMKYMTILFLLFATVLSAHAQGGGASQRGPVIVEKKPTPTSKNIAPADFKLIDYKNSHREISNETDLKKGQFYSGDDTIMLVAGMPFKKNGKDTVLFRSHRCTTNDTGAFMLVDRRLMILPHTKLTYWKEVDGVMWMTCYMDTAAHLIGDSISLPFLSYGDAGANSYVVKNNSSKGAGVPGKLAPNAHNRFQYVTDAAGTKTIFLIVDGLGSVSLKAWFGKSNAGIPGKDKTVNSSNPEPANVGSPDSGMEGIEFEMYAP